MPQPVIRSGSKCYGMDCPDVYFSHAPTCDSICVQNATEWTARVNSAQNASTCDNVPVQSATDWTALVHTLHMPQHVIVQNAMEGH